MLWIFTIVTGIPVMTFPGIIMANVMMAAAPKTPNASLLKQRLMKAFMFLTTIYPLTYFLCIFKVFKYPIPQKYLPIAIILLHILLMIGLFIISVYLEKKEFRQRPTKKAVD